MADHGFGTGYDEMHEEAKPVYAAQVRHSIPIGKILSWVAQYGWPAVTKVMRTVPPNGFRGMTNEGLLEWIANAIAASASGANVAVPTAHP